MLLYMHFNENDQMHEIVKKIAPKILKKNQNPRICL
jgi:hypothetical protein